MQRARIVYPEYPVQTKISFMQWYHGQFFALEGCLLELQKKVMGIVRQQGLHPTVKSRVKSFHSYFDKIQIRTRENGKASGRVEINDVLGMRVICPFSEDLHQVEQVLQANFHVHEVERKGSEYSFQEFGYESTHYLLWVPDEVARQFELEEGLLFEVQLRTILQDAWAEVEHELIYKAEFTPFDQPLKRKLAALNANLSLADIIFQEIRDYQRQLHQQMDRRRRTFMGRLHEVLDAELKDELYDQRELRELERQHSSERMTGIGSIEPNGFAEIPDRIPVAVTSAENIDSFLLRALYAHNAGRYDESIALYSSILSGSPETYVRAIIYIHRGMAQFARGNYSAAVEDFYLAVQIDEANGKARYYCGMALYMQDNLEEAINNLDIALASGYRELDCLFSRALVYYRLGDMASALSDCDDALQLDEDSRSVRRLRTRIVQKLGV